jgi:hypothetical protein
VNPKNRVLVAVLLVAGLTSCSPAAGNKVASARSESPQASVPATSVAPDTGRQFAACLRSRGVDVADPAPGQQVQLKSKDDKAKAALRACAQFAPIATTGPDDTFDPVAARAYAACIRAKGFPDFPDPDDQGIRVPKNLVNDARFNQADRDCAPLLNQPSGGTK